MTSEFDNLRALQQTLIRAAPFGKATEAEIAAIQWLTERCVKEASSKRADWNWGSWKQKDMYIRGYGELYAKLEFLGDCHMVLDHREFHHKVFTLDTQVLIDILYAAIIDKKDELYQAKGRTLNRNPHLAELLQSLGYKPDKDYGGMYRRAKS